MSGSVTSEYAFSSVSLMCLLIHLCCLWGATLAKVQRLRIPGPDLSNHWSCRFAAAM
jgi:hypothetical protein